MTELQTTRMPAGLNEPAGIDLMQHSHALKKSLLLCRQLPPTAAGLLTEGHEARHCPIHSGHCFWHIHLPIPPKTTYPGWSYVLLTPSWNSQRYQILTHIQPEKAHLALQSLKESFALGQIHRYQSIPNHVLQLVRPKPVEPHRCCLIFHL